MKILFYQKALLIFSLCLFLSSCGEDAALSELPISNYQQERITDYLMECGHDLECIEFGEEKVAYGHCTHCQMTSTYAEMELLLNAPADTTNYESNGEIESRQRVLRDHLAIPTTNEIKNVSWKIDYSGCPGSCAWSDAILPAFNKLEQDLRGCASCSLPFSWVNFTQASASQTPDILIKFDDIDATGLADRPSAGKVGKEITLTTNDIPPTFQIRRGIVMHEILHTFGLQHTDQVRSYNMKITGTAGTDSKSVMNASVGSVNSTLSAHDKKAFRKLFPRFLVAPAVTMTRSYVSSNNYAYTVTVINSGVNRPYYGMRLRFKKPGNNQYYWRTFKSNAFVQQNGKWVNVETFNLPANVEYVEVRGENMKSYHKNDASEVRSSWSAKAYY